MSTVSGSAPVVGTGSVETVRIGADDINTSTASAQIPPVKELHTAEYFTDAVRLPVDSVPDPPMLVHLTTPDTVQSSEGILVYTVQSFIADTVEKEVQLIVAAVL